MADRTPTQALASTLLGIDVLDWIAERRNARPKWSFALLADELAKVTGGKVEVTGEAIRQWLAVDAAAS